MNLSITSRRDYSPPVEFVERKGTGHPDTICDRLAEDLARRLAGEYLDHTGQVQHFNVDKAVLAAGAVDVGYGGGTHLKPSRLVLVGKADFNHDWKPDPEQLAVEFKRRLLDILPNAGADAFEVEIWLNQSSAALATVVAEGHRAPGPLANDTSFAAVSEPRSRLEQAVFDIERRLNDDTFRTTVPVGRDVKVMGARTGSEITITVAAPVLAERVNGRPEYDDAVAAIHDETARVAAETFETGTTVQVNQADTEDSPYLTLTGSSAEAGDDGQVGRGNRFGGLITPYRPMSLEATAGKNPATHVGKTYHAIASDAGRAIIRETAASEATIRMLSSIGHPVTEPQAVHVEVAGEVEEEAIRAILERSVADWEGVRDRLIAGEYVLF